MKKKVLVLGSIVFLLFIGSMCARYYDGARVSAGKEPKLVIKTYSDRTEAVTYWGLGYKVVRYVAMSPNEPYDHHIGVKMGSWFMKYEKPAARFPMWNTGFSVESWWPEYGEKVMEILDTLKFEREFEDSKIKKIGLSLAMKNVTPSGATLVFQQADGNPTGKLQFGDDFIIEKQEKGEWKEVSVVVEGNYGFNAIAYSIANDSTTEFEVDWEWLYEQLEPGEYRIGKTILDFRETRDYDEYMIYGYFVLGMDLQKLWETSYENRTYCNVFE